MRTVEIRKNRPLSRFATVDLVPGTAPNNTPPFQAWETFETPFTAAAFGTTQPQWDAILANVTEVQLSVEALFGQEIEGLDNIGLVPEPAPPATAGAAALALAARAGARRRRARVAH